MRAYNTHYTIWVMADGTQKLLANMVEIFRGTKEEVANYMKEHNITLTKGW